MSLFHKQKNNRCLLQQRLFENLALFFILVALIVRAVGIEYRSKRASATWRKAWDIATAISSILAAALWGVAVGNLVTGVPIDENMQYAGSFFTLLTPFTLLTGVMFALLFLYHEKKNFIFNLAFCFDCLRRHGLFFRVDAVFSSCRILRRNAFKVGRLS